MSKKLDRHPEVVDDENKPLTEPKNVDSRALEREFDALFEEDLNRDSAYGGDGDTAIRPASPTVDLNKERIKTTGTVTYARSVKQAGPAPAQCTVYFEDIVDHLVEHIREQEARFVVGAVAWMTHPRVYEALYDKEGVSIILNKDVGRSLSGKKPTSVARQRYDSLHAIPERFYRAQLDTLVVGHGESKRELKIEPLLCCGNINVTNSRVWSRMHNKFLVFCRGQEPYDPFKGEPDPDFLKPYAVWTGSFNMTGAATRSFENAVYIDSERIASAYFAEWLWLLAHSESLLKPSPTMQPPARYDEPAPDDSKVSDILDWFASPAAMEEYFAWAENKQEEVEDSMID